MQEQNNKRKYFQGLGRRKSAVARVRLYPKGKGDFVINEKTSDQFFKYFEFKKQALDPLKKFKQEKNVDVSVKVNGGGPRGQAEAIQLGIARALVVMNEEYKMELRKHGFLTRDSRKKERKKPGLKRARRAPQWRKR